MASDPNQIQDGVPITNEQPKNVSKKQKRTIALAPLRRLMKAEGVNLVSMDALEFLRDKLEEEAIKVVKKTVTMVNAEQRKRIQASDITDAIKTP